MKYLSDETYGTTTADQIRLNRAIANRTTETTFAMYVRHGITIKRWTYSDGSGIVFIIRNPSEDAYRKYATAAYADAYLFTVFTRILEVACDREEAEVRLNQSLVGDPEHDLYNLYGHPQIAIMKE